MRIIPDSTHFFLTLLQNSQKVFKFLSLITFLFLLLIICLATLIKKKLSGFFRAETFKGSVNLDISISETKGENLTFINHHENKSQTHVYNTLHLKYIL